jgi:hypothetical protein
LKPLMTPASGISTRRRSTAPACPSIAWARRSVARSATVSCSRPRSGACCGRGSGDHGQFEGAPIRTGTTTPLTA